MPAFGEGPIPAKVMIVGEAWGAEEERLGRPFVGSSGAELNKMLEEAGIRRAECYVTNVVNARPQNNDLRNWIAGAKKDITEKHFPLRGKYVTKNIIDGYVGLLQEISLVKPNIIIALGNLAMWALAGQWGILKWRGSQLRTDIGQPVNIIPTIHPAAILRQWELRALAVNDLRRAKKQMHAQEYTNIPNWKFVIRPSFQTACSFLDKLLLTITNSKTPYWVDVDLETSKGHIACIGLSTSRIDAICIPFTTQKNFEGFWGSDEEAWLVYKIYKALTHPNVLVRWQNGLFDAQYIYRRWHFIPRHGQDTMISQHSAFCALPKSLSFIASMYADYYQYWKEDK